MRMRKYYLANDTAGHFVTVGEVPVSPSRAVNKVPVLHGCLLQGSLAEIIETRRVIRESR